MLLFTLQARDIKSQQDLIVQQQWELQRMEEQRKLVEEERQKKEVA